MIVPGDADEFGGRVLGDARPEQPHGNRVLCDGGIVRAEFADSD